MHLTYTEKYSIIAVIDWWW